MVPVVRPFFRAVRPSLLSFPNTKAVDVLPPGALVPSQGVYWVIEGAAFVLMKLASRGAQRRRPLHTVKVRE